MKKQIKIIIAASAVLLLLVGVMIFLLTLPVVESDTTAESSSGAATLISQSSKDIEQITVDNSGGKYTLMLYNLETEVSEESSSSSSEADTSKAETVTTLIFTMQEHSQYQLDNDKTDTLAAECATLSATKTVNSKGKSDSDYGLDSPRSTVSVRFSDGTEKTICVGSDAPGDEGVYIRIDGDSNIYLVAKDSVSAMLTEKLQMFNKYILDELSDGDRLQSLNVSGKGRTSPLTIENNSISDVSNYYITSSDRGVCDNTKIETLCDAYLFPFVANSVEAIDVTDEQLKKYGFDEPYYIMDVKSADISSRIIVSKPDKNNNCYIMTDGEKIVYKISSDSISFMSGDGSDYMSSTVLCPNELNVKTLTASYGSTKNEYSLTHTKKLNEDKKEVISTNVKLSGGEIGANRFNTFLKNLSVLERSSKAAEIDDKSKAMLTVAVTYEDNTADTLELFEKDKKAVIILNGKSVGTTEPETAQTLLSDAQALAANKDFESLVDDENEASDTASSTTVSE